MKILFFSNAPWTATGYGNQTKINVPRIARLGHEVALCAFYGLEGGALTWEGMHVFPRGYLPYGQDVISAHSEQFEADITITLVDAWIMEPEMMTPKTRWVPWYPVDMFPLPPPVLKKVNRAFDRIVYSKFGEKMTHNAGLDCHYVPHCVETKTFIPLDMAEARKKLPLPMDRFIVGMVAANKGMPSRKAFEPQIRAFAALKKKHPDALLYLHTSLGVGVSDALNIPEVCGRPVRLPDRIPA
jgi:hypothetical protein